MSANASIARRNFIFQLGAGLGSTALSWMLSQDSLVAAENHSSGFTNPLLPKKPHFAARAKSCIFLMMEGGASHMDTFDPKPKLNQVEGQIFQRTDEKLESNQTRGDRYFVGSPFQFKKHGQCGMDVSELFQETAKSVDDMAFVRSAYAESDNHPAALFHFLTGKPVQGYPSIGSWMTYGLGTFNQNLPAFVVLRDGRPFGGTSTWNNAFLPSCYQGTQFRSGDHPVLDLNPPEAFTRDRQRRGLDLLNRFNQEHSIRHPTHPDLEARIANYELAFRMQTEVPEAVAIRSEPDYIKAQYGLDQKETKTFGTRCLLARRLIERGVRFVQVWSGGWDSHDSIESGHRNAAKRVDRPIAGLLADMKQRGLLDETLVVWGGEFGRTPDTNATNEKRNTQGRDHNPGAMTVWFAGGGVQGGSRVGSTDDLGNKAVESPFHLRDIHATLLHLFGLDQSKLTFYHGGRFKQLTDTGGTIIRNIIT